MTVIGKIMVFFVLLLSLLQGAFTILLYTARVHWVSEYSQLKSKYEVARSNADQYAAEAKRAEKEADDKVAQVEVKYKALLDERNLLAQKNIALTNNQLERDKEKARVDALVSSSQISVERMQSDVNKLSSTLDEQIAINKKLVDDNNDLRKVATTKEIEANGLRARNGQLVTQLETLAKENVQIKNTLTRGTSVTARNAENPPQRNVEGVVKETDPSGLMTISIGSDAGLVEGNTLKVFRVASVADQSKYLGTIRLIKVNATEAVGQPLGRMNGPVQKNDQVASRILGGG